MSLKTIQVPSFDPNIYTGSFRLLAGPARTGNIVPGVPYGLNGITEYATWLYVGTTGDILYVKWDGTNQLLTNIQAGIWHRFEHIMVSPTGTTASGMVWGS